MRVLRAFLLGAIGGALGLMLVNCTAPAPDEHTVIAGLYATYDAAAAGELAWLRSGKRPKETVNRVEALRNAASYDLQTLMLTAAAKQPTEEQEAKARASIDALLDFMRNSKIPVKT